jgi:hypothetical protein
MANLTYSVACPSCDAAVSVKSGAAAARKKIECPKCKYRFVAPPPDDEEADEPAAEEAGKKKKKKGSGATVMVGAALGVLAVGLLGAGGYFLFADGETTTVTKNNPPRPPVKPNPPPATDPGTVPPKQQDKEPPKEQPKVKTPSGPPKDLTNMLPNDTVSVVRVNFEKVAQQTPFFSAFFDGAVRDQFRASLALNPDDLAAYIHCAVGKDVREPFGVLRTKAPVDQVAFWHAIRVTRPTRGPVKQREYFLLENNSFLNSVGRALTTDSLRGLFGQPTEAPAAAAADAPLAMHLFDTQTVVIAPEARMVGFLESLERDTDLPKYLTELTTAAPTPKDPPKGPTPPVSNPKGPVTQPVPNPKDPPKTDPAPTRKLYTSVPTYRTIDPALKKLLNQLEEDDRNEPAVLVVELADQRHLARQNLPGFARDIPPGVLDFLDAIKTVGLSLTNFTQDKFVGTVVVEFVKEEDAKAALKDKLMPGLNLIQTPLGTALGTQFTIKSGGQPTAPGTGQPGQPGPTPGPRPFPGEEGDPRPGVPGPGGPTSTPPRPKVRPSTIDASITDTTVTLTASVQWNEELYRFTINPAVTRLAAQLKGKMAVLSGDVDWYATARGVRKVTAVPPVKFPAGTLEREVPVTRLKQPYPPETRVSFFADLLPYLGRSGLRGQIDGKKDPWFAKDNLEAAEAWVPEFVVPYYPQSSWRGTHPYAEGKSLGGTNYVGLAGLGLDAARYDPKNPDHAKKLGMTGYDWGSAAADVTDGLSNTAYLAQVPPATNRPWIVGGGATLTGVDEADPQSAFLVPTPDGKRGTYLLMGDGSVRFVGEKANPSLFKALITRAGGESLKEIDTFAPRVPQRNANPDENEIKNEAIENPPKKVDPPKSDAAEVKPPQGK